MVRVAIYGHARGMDKDITELAVLLTNSNRGIATIYIDLPNHGSRIADDSSDIFLTDLAEARRFLGMVTQASLDLHSVLLSVKTALATLNVAPSNNFWNHWFFRRGLNTVDLDVDKIFYEGTSLGDTTGATFVSSTGDLKGGF